MRKILLFLSVLFSCSLTAQNNNVQKYVNKELKTDSLFQNAVVGIYAEDAEGKALAQWNPDFPLLTASTLKTITTGAAMVLLGEDFRYQTKLAYSGIIADSTLTGNIYIIGGGDPTLGAELPLATPVSEVFGSWTDALKRAGIKEIRGLVIPDDRYFKDEILPPTWCWGDLGESYGSGTSGLCFYENAQIFYFFPSDSIGAQVDFLGCYPDIPSMNYNYSIGTGEEDSDTEVYYYTSDLSKAGNLVGTIAAGEEIKALSFSNKFPHLSCGRQFVSYLETHGISCSVTVEDIDDVAEADTNELIIIDTTYSAPLSEIVKETNVTSNNLFAETIFKTVAKEMTGVGSYDSARVVMNRFLQEKNISLTGYTQCDGSGLSRENYLSPRFFSNFYRMMYKSNTFAKYLESFPVPGMPGSTLSSVLKGEDEVVKERIHAKSGSLSNVRCYAGYVDSPEGPISFAILVNNYAAKTSQVQPKIEGFLKELSIYAGKKK